MPLLGAVKLSRLSRPAVEKFVDQLLDAGRSRPLAKKALASLVAVIGEAQRRGMVAQNVAAGVKVTTEAAQGQATIPSKEQLRAALARARGRERALLVLAVFSGLRASEIRGLRWSDVDFGAQLLRVRQRADTGGRMARSRAPAVAAIFRWCRCW